MIEAQTLISATNGFSFVQGEFAITIVSDGFITVPIDIVAPEGSAEERAHILRSTGNIKAGLVESKTNIPVIRKGRDLILFGNSCKLSDGFCRVLTRRVRFESIADPVPHSELVSFWRASRHRFAAQIAAVGFQNP